MIIGVSGYINSGKDTVGNIIQYLHSQELPSSYDFKKYATLDEWLEVRKYNGFDIGGKSMYELEYKLFKIQKFAGAVKRIAAMLLNVDEKLFEDRKYKDTQLGLEWDNMTVRQFLQKLGTDAMRYGLHPNVWVNALMGKYTYTPDGLPLKKWIITDVRFPNEARAIKDRGGFIIRINRYPPGVSPKLMDLHESETALDEWEFDHVVWNNGTIEDLTNQIKEILKINKVNLAES